MEDKSSNNQKGTKWLNRNVAGMGFTSLFSYTSHEIARATRSGLKVHAFVTILL
jgi:hypothetical protein